MDLRSTPYGEVADCLHQSSAEVRSQQATKKRLHEEDHRFDVQTNIFDY